MTPSGVISVYRRIFLLTACFVLMKENMFH